jgi:hypothetical protein
MQGALGEKLDYGEHSYRVTLWILKRHKHVSIARKTKIHD